MAATFSFVLLGRFPGKDRAVAQALARDFGRDDTWGLQVVGAAPIVLLDNLTAEQADAVHDAVAEIEEVGCRFEIQSGLDTGLPKISWPAPPKIKGRPVSELASLGFGGNVATLIVPCPYTGQRLKLTISVNVSRADPMPGQQGAAPGMSVGGVPTSIPVPSAAQPRGVPAAYTAIPTPIVNSARPAAPTPGRGVPLPGNRNTPPARAVAVPRPGLSSQSQASAAAVGERAPVIIGLDNLDELVPLEQLPASTPAPQPQRPAARPAPAAPQGRPVGGVAPLPDIPVINTPIQPQAAGDNFSSAPMPNDALSAPMDLSAFERGVSGVVAAVPPELLQEHGEGQDDSAVAADDGSLCSLFIGKTNNARAHQMIADLQGISVQEAAKMCQRPVVAIAKDVTGAEAAEIKQQFASINMSVRVTKRRA